jgi:hypothetical protein
LPSVIENKKPVSALAKNGFALALAVFFTRPQADHQIGALGKLLLGRANVKAAGNERAEMRSAKAVNCET